MSLEKYNIISEYYKFVLMQIQAKENKPFIDDVVKAHINMMGDIMKADRLFVIQDSITSISHKEEDELKFCYVYLEKDVAKYYKRKYQPRGRISMINHRDIKKTIDGMVTAGYDGILLITDKHAVCKPIYIGTVTEITEKIIDAAEAEE